MRMLLIQYPQFKGDELRYILFFDRTFYTVFIEDKTLYNNFMSKIEEVPDETYYSELKHNNADFEPMLNEMYYSRDDICAKNNEKIIDLIARHERYFKIPTPNDSMYAYCEISVSYPRNNVDYLEYIKDKLKISYDKYKEEIKTKYYDSYVRSGGGDIIEFEVD